MSILEELYNGNINPLKERMPVLIKYRTAFYEKEELFIAKLDKEMWKEYEDLLDDYFECFPVEMSEEFAKGFKMAVRMLNEIFNT